jgi:thiamine pyrophosphokinase
VENPPRVLGVLSGRDADGALLKRWAQSATNILAADGGANILYGCGIAPHVVIGDLDSISENARNAAHEVIRVDDQNSTDCDKLLLYAQEKGFVAITLACGEGDLPDHVLATLQSAARSSLDVRIAYRRGIGWIIKPNKPFDIETSSNRRLSLLPITNCEGVTLRGCHWQLEHAPLSPAGLTSISNRTEGGGVRVTMTKGVALLFIEFEPAEMPLW